MLLLPKPKSMAAAAVATLALLGQGGKFDLGGPTAAPQLPLLPQEPIWNWRRRTGRAWCAALREVMGDYKLAVVSTNYTIKIGMLDNIKLGDDPYVAFFGIYEFGKYVSDSLTLPLKWIDALIRVVRLMVKNKGTASLVTGEKIEIFYGAVDGGAVKKKQPGETDNIMLSILAEQMQKEKIDRIRWMQQNMQDRDDQTKDFWKFSAAETR
jgi:hypothetical protein